MELWGGVECTINRVGDQYFNQIERSGHFQRGCADLERFAALGLRKVGRKLVTRLHTEHLGRALYKSTPTRGR